MQNFEKVNKINLLHAVVTSRKNKIHLCGLFWHDRWHFNKYQGPDKYLARPTSRYILFDGENISSDASLVIYINSTNIPPIMIINRI